MIGGSGRGYKGCHDPLVYGACVPAMLSYFHKVCLMLYKAWSQSCGFCDKCVFVCRHNCLFC